MSRASLIRNPESVNATMFGAGEDLPLFSGTPQTVVVKGKARAGEPIAQARMSECPICFDTGIVVVQGKKRHCWCEASNAQRIKDELMASTSKRLARVRRNAAGAYPEDHSDDDHVLREAIAIETPAQRFAYAGATGLSLIELIAIVIGEQTPSIAANIITKFQTVAQIAKAEFAELTSVPGVTARRAMQLVAAIELAQRSQATEKTMIKTPQDFASVIGPKLAGLQHEQMWVACLDTKNNIKAMHCVYQGSVHTTVIRIAELFKVAVQCQAAGVIVAHNHPSTDPTPSPVIWRKMSSPSPCWN